MSYSSRKKVLFIDRLDYLSLFLFVILRPIYKKIYYRGVISSWKGVEKKLFFEKLGFHEVTYKGVKFDVVNKFFDLNDILAEKVLKNKIKRSVVYQYLIKVWNVNSASQKKIEKTLITTLFSDYFYSGTSSVPLINYNFSAEKYKIYYIPYRIQDYLMVKELPDPSIVTICLHCLLNAIYQMTIIALRTVLRLITQIIPNLIKKKAGNLCMKFRKPEAKKEENQDRYGNERALRSAPIAYCPHKGLKYGDFFKKTYIYSNNTESPLYRENLLTVSFEEPDNISKRYYRRFKIPYYNFNSKNYLKSQIEFMFKIIISLNIKILLEFRELSSIFTTFLMISFLKTVHRDLKSLDELPKLKILYAHYDILFPQHFAFSCHLKGVKVMALQDRFVSYVYFRNLVFDYYFIVGRGFQKSLEDYGYFCGKYLVAGAPRSSYIKNSCNLNQEKYKDMLDLKKKYKILLCFGTHPSEENEKDFGEDGTSFHSCIDLIETMYKIAENNDRLYIFIRFKDNAWLKEKKYIDLLRKVQTARNIEIMMNLKKYNSYEMCALADLIVGKHTSIMEEAFSAGKKIVFYDTEGFLECIKYPLNKFDIIESDFDGLQKRILDIIDNNNYLQPQEWEECRNIYFGAKGDFPTITENIVNIFNDMKNERPTNIQTLQFVD